MTIGTGSADHDPIPERHPSNWFSTDPYLQWLMRTGLDASLHHSAFEALTELGQIASTTLDELATTAESHPPVLHTHDNRGLIRDEIEFHPAYNELERQILQFGVVRAAYTNGWRGLTGRAPRLLVAALQYLVLEADQSVMGCPIGMSDAMARCLELNDPALAARFVPRLADDTGSWLRGAMFLTERFGGSDVGANQTVAHNIGDRVWQLTGEKWFASCPHSDLVLITARPEGAPAGTKGLGLFLLPRILEDGTRNSYTIRRLKDKFGTRAMPSGEVVLDHATAWLVGDVTHGMRQMLDMINHSRMCISLVAAAAMRRNVTEAVAHSADRVVFGKRLITQPLMVDTLLEMETDAISGAAAAFTLAQLTDRTDAGSVTAAKTLRLLTPIYKGYATERARITAIEGMEVRGGNGVINDWPEARILRDITVHAIWEGSSNVVALDALRAFSRHADAMFDLGQPIAPVPPHELFRLLQSELADARATLVGEVQALSKLPSRDQQLRSRRLARRCAITCIAMTLEEQSHAQCAEDGRVNLALIALRLLSRLWTEEDRTALLSAPVWLTIGDQLLAGDPVQPAIIEDILPLLSTRMRAVEHA